MKNIKTPRKKRLIIDDDLTTFKGLCIQLSKRLPLKTGDVITILLKQDDGIYFSRDFSMKHPVDVMAIIQGDDIELLAKEIMNEIGPKRDTFLLSLGGISDSINNPLGVN